MPLTSPTSFASRSGSIFSQWLPWQRPGYGLPRAIDSVPAVLSGPLGRSGSLEVRLARSAADVWKCQRLRYRVFYEEMSARPDAKALVLRRDADRYDKICDHLMVIDHNAPGAFGKRKSRVVGTYRVLRQEIAERSGGFYTQGEFDIAPLIARHAGSRFLELGRSCVLEPYRTKKTVELLWHGIWAYVRHYRIDVMIGCASLEGVDPARLAIPLSFLHHHAGAPQDWHAQAHGSRFVAMGRIDKAAIDPKAAIRSLPPLIKAYLRLGAVFGEGAVIDRQFGTTDVLVVLPISKIDPRYLDYYGTEGQRYAA
jgi:L-ornithine Nalpha-acyltransferase